jgi:hypothetical protein
MRRGRQPTCCEGSPWHAIGRLRLEQRVGERDLSFGKNIGEQPRREDIRVAGAQQLPHLLERVDDHELQVNIMRIGELTEQLVLIAHRLTTVLEVARRVVARADDQRVAGEDLRQGRARRQARSVRRRRT